MIGRCCTKNPKVGEACSRAERDNADIQTPPDMMRKVVQRLCLDSGEMMSVHVNHDGLICVITCDLQNPVTPKTPKRPWLYGVSYVVLHCPAKDRCDLRELGTPARPHVCRHT